MVLFPLSTLYQWVSKMTGLGHTAFLACLLVTNFGPVEPVENDGRCPSPQYAEIGQEGIIECSVPLTFEGVVWYNSTNTTDSLVARIERQSDGSLRISGEGVNTGSYTIASNGSLIITEVTTKHNRNFTVLILNEMYEASSFTVELIILVYSRQRFPAVNSFEANLVLLEPVTRNATLSCSFQNVRPAVTLSWFKFNKGKFENFEARQYSSSDDGLSFSTVSHTTIPSLTYNSLHLFSCRAYGPAVRVKEARTDVLVIAENRRMKSGRKCHTEIRKETVFADSSIKIPCTEDGHPYAFIWQFAGTNHSQILMLSTNGMVRWLNKMNTTLYVSTDGSLLFPHVDRSMKGVYTCFFLMGDTSSCNNVEIQVKARVGIKTEVNSRASPSLWMIIPFVVTAFVALLTLVYVLDRHRQEGFTKIIKAISNFRFETKDLEIYGRDVLKLLRTVSMDIDGYRESTILEILESKAVIKSAEITFPGPDTVTFNFGKSVGLVVAGKAEGTGGSRKSIGCSLEKLVKDPNSIKLLKPALEAFISIQRDLAEIVVLLSIAYKIAGSKKWRRRLTRKILQKSKSYLQDIQALQEGAKESLDQILSKLKIKAKDLVSISIGPEFETENLFHQNTSQWKSFLQEEPRKSFDCLEEAVRTVLQEQDDLNGTPTLLALVKRLYGNLPDSTAVDLSTEGNTHAANNVNLSDDGSNVGANVSKIAKGVSAVGVVLSAIGVKVNLEFLGKAAYNVLSKERKNFSQALRDASDIMRKINNIASPSVQGPSGSPNTVTIDYQQEPATSNCLDSENV